MPFASSIAHRAVGGVDCIPAINPRERQGHDMAHRVIRVWALLIVALSVALGASACHREPHRGTTPRVVSQTWSRSAVTACAVAAPHNLTACHVTWYTDRADTERCAVAYHAQKALGACLMAVELGRFTAQYPTLAAMQLIEYGNADSVNSGFTLLIGQGTTAHRCGIEVRGSPGYFCGTD